MIHQKWGVTWLLGRSQLPSAPREAQQSIREEHQLLCAAGHLLQLRGDLILQALDADIQGVGLKKSAVGSIYGRKWAIFLWYIPNFYA